MIDHDDLPFNFFIFQKLIRSRVLYVRPFYIDDGEAKNIGGTNYQAVKVEVEEYPGEPPYRIVLSFSVDHGTGVESVVYSPTDFENVQLKQQKDGTWLAVDNFENLRQEVNEEAHQHEPTELPLTLHFLLKLLSKNHKVWLDDRAVSDSLIKISEVELTGRSGVKIVGVEEGSKIGRTLIYDLADFESDDIVIEKGPVSGFILRCANFD